MADVYWIGVFLGLGLGVGVLLAGLLGASRAGLLVALALAAVAGFVVGIALSDEPQAAAGAIGGIFGSIGTAEIVRGALRRGGARMGTALLVAFAALVVAALAFVPLVGYLETLALPVLAARMRRRQPERYAGLRSLARD
jgi:membrane associated rhomboid family serine protease